MFCVCQLVTQRISDHCNLNSVENEMHILFQCDLYNDLRKTEIHYLQITISGAPNDNFRESICSEDDLRSRIFGTFVVKFLACLPLLGFSKI